MKKVLSIAGSDCSGGAGIQADLKTFSAHGVFGMSVIVSVVAENTSRVIDIQNVTPDMIEKQIDAVFEDIEVDAVKIGMHFHARMYESSCSKSQTVQAGKCCDRSCYVCQKWLSSYGTHCCIYFD